MPKHRRPFACDVWRLLKEEIKRQRKADAINFLITHQAEIAQLIGGRDD